MKSSVKKIIAIICAFIFLAAPLQTYAAGSEDGKFVELSVVGYDKEGKQKTESSVFYVKDNVLYAPVEFFEKYTLYRYDNEKNAFIRSSQEYMKSTSKVIFDYEKNKARVLYSATYAEDYDMITYLHGNTRFFPFAQTAGYLKSSIVYQDKDKISVVNSGISMWDALYDYIPEGESLSYAKICDDLYAGNDLIYTVSGALGYFGETVFDFRLSNLVVIGPYADIKKYEDILSSAVTNNDIYKAAFDKNTLQSELLDLTFKRIVGDLYGSAEKTYSLTSQAISTIYDDHKDSIFTDDNLYDTPFQNMKSEIKELKEIGEIVDVVGKVIDVAEYIYEFAQMNSDNRDALAYANMNCQTKDSEAKAIGNVAVKYVGAVDTDFLKDQLVESVKEELKDFDNAKSVLEYANKIKLATSIVNAAFKLGGFDLADNSSYDVLMASDLYYYLINKSPVIDQGYAKTLKESEEMRLANIMLMLVNIEAYKMGNDVAKKIDKTDSNHYGRQIAEMEQRLAMLYRSKNSEKYDCIEGIKTVIEENQEEIAKFDFAALNSTEYQNTDEETIRQYNYNLRRFDDNATVDYDIVDYTKDYIVYFDVSSSGNYPQGNIVRMNRSDNVKENILGDVSISRLVIYNNEIYYSDMRTRCIYKCDLNGKGQKKVFEDHETDGNSSRTIPNEFIISGGQMIVETTFLDGGERRLYCVDLNSGNKKLLDSKYDPRNYGIQLFTHENILYYNTADILKAVDLETGKIIREVKFNAANHLIKIDQGCLYYIREEFREGPAYFIEKINLSNFKIEKISTVQSSGYIHSIFIDNDKIFVITSYGERPLLGIIVKDKAVHANEVFDKDQNYIKINYSEIDIGLSIYAFGDTLYVNNYKEFDRHNYVAFYKVS